MTYIDGLVTIPDLLEKRAADDAEESFCYFDEGVFTVRQVHDAVNRLAGGLVQLGITSGDRVAVMLPNHPDYIITMLALIKLRAVWVPINVHLRGPSLKYIVEHSQPKAMIVDTHYQDVLYSVLSEHQPSLLIWRGGDGSTRQASAVDFAEICSATNAIPPRPTASASDVICISYTSGTTGAPKGVLVTDKMLRACATGSIMSADISDNDVLLLWEPLHHIAGSQVVIVGLIKHVKIALLERFSAVRFWSQVHQYQATHIHYVGGILQILLKQPRRSADADNPVRIAWGGGCTAEVWEEFERRFGVHIHEVYGLTEASSISTMNPEGPVGSIGKPAPYFNVRVVDDEAAPIPPGTVGEIIIGEREQGILTPGYFRNPEQSSKALRGGWLFTGDLARVDDDGFLYYSGRKSDSVRHRGENISAWEVERIINEHPDVELSALVGVATDIGEFDLKIFVKLVDGRDPDPEGLTQWCESRMPYFQIPRYVAYIENFEMTPTHRIRKETLLRTVVDCWDRHSLD